MVLGEWATYTKNLKPIPTIFLDLFFFYFFLLQICRLIFLPSIVVVLFARDFFLQSFFSAFFLSFLFILIFLRREKYSINLSQYRFYWKDSDEFQMSFIQFPQKKNLEQKLFCKYTTNK